MVQDLRVIKTQAAIHQAFWHLLSQRTITQITVADLIHEAQIGKATFYHHYIDKYDLARKLCDQTQAPLLKECTRRIATRRRAALFAPLPEVIMADATHLALCDHMQSPELNGQARMIAKLSMIWQAAINAQHPNFPEVKAVSDELATLYQHILLHDLIGDGTHSPATLTAAIQAAIPLLFPH